jgi:hypothetical protein
MDLKGELAHETMSSLEPSEPYPISNEQNVRKTITRNGRQRLFTVIFGSDGKPRIPAFTNIQISTMTVIVYTNMIVHVKKLLKYLPVTPWIVLKKKRGRKKKVQLEEPNSEVPPGSIISLKHRKEVRGVLLKPLKVSKGNGEYWKHSVSVVMILENLKMLNVKVSRNGKLQMTGCKSIEHAIDFVKYLYGRMIEAEEWSGECLFSFKQNLEDVGACNTDLVPADREKVSLDVDGLWVCFRGVMVNKDFDCGYKIRRNRLDALVNHHTEFRSIFESSLGSNVNIKRRAVQYIDPNMPRLRITKGGECIEDTMPYEQFVQMLPEKDRKNLIKEAYHTFMVFASGRIIMSSSGPEMPWIFNQFVHILVEYRNVLEEARDDEVMNSEWFDESAAADGVKSGPTLARDLDRIIQVEEAERDRALAERPCAPFKPGL